MSTIDRIAPIELELRGRQRLVVTCDAPQVPSDGGALLLRQLDEHLSLTRTLAELLEDNRDPGRRRHELLAQLRQRVHQMWRSHVKLRRP